MDGFSDDDFSAPRQPTITAPHVSAVAPAVAVGGTTWTHIVLYISLGFLFLLLTYLAVQYSKDVSNRRSIDGVHNLSAYVDYVAALANRQPTGHAVRSAEVDEEISEYQYDSEFEKSE